MVKGLVLPFPSYLFEEDRMKVKYHFEYVDLDDGIVAVPVGHGAAHFHGVLKVNETGAAILKLLDRDTTEDQIVTTLLKEYDGDRDQIARYVHDYIGKLAAESLVE